MDREINFQRRQREAILLIREYQFARIVIDGKFYLHLIELFSWSLKKSNKFSLLNCFFFAEELICGDKDFLLKLVAWSQPIFIYVKCLLVIKNHRQK